MTILRCTPTVKADLGQNSASYMRIMAKVSCASILKQVSFDKVGTAFWSHVRVVIVGGPPAGLGGGLAVLGVQPSDTLSPDSIT